MVLLKNGSVISITTIGPYSVGTIMGQLEQSSNRNQAIAIKQLANHTG
jgi:hypothetical protein